MGYPSVVRDRAVTLSAKGMRPEQVRAQLVKEGVDPVPSAAAVRQWSVHAQRGVAGDHRRRTAAEIAAVVRAYLASGESAREVALQYGVSPTSVNNWALQFAPDEDTRRGMTPEQLEQATLYRVEKQRRTPRKSSGKSRTAAVSKFVGDAADSGVEAPFDEVALPDDPEELKALLRHERFMRLADRALFDAVMESEGKAPARRRSTVWSSLKLSNDSGHMDTK